MIDDEQRFADVYRRTHGTVLSYAARRAPEDTAREATDETYLIAWRRFDVVPPDPLPWLIVTVRNVLSELGRRDARQTTLARQLTHENRADGVTTKGHVDDAVLERVVVHSALATLSSSDRETLMLTAWDGLTARQAATVVGCSPATFAVRHHRARRRLQSALDAADHRTPAAQLHPDRSQP
ncbi:sigma-70 family RNA polymerase sigma factor [Rhodococcus sp. BP-349]|uniref:RNA polymerase sigma factor n=1 Tax=unclassified Rhodococcus (in: high G+C Gram-positive bacteria) TaxID=192944 RepID=UPI001C9AB640|nr:MULTISPECIES: sigma-70 family RNA polymerase sigma factor [unclassified Rhodococcus (in: high G+C Gram-positive bacteria)]MBY6540302.1 sigma-70 family RNA polymerase sigma factor [Rhodococcus sp. BP-363]MBY6545673.1 sigma-70 family RNA polymerase sigma factor [Rhodococcus sp. BP-369]MBY6564903.1 sigma-70 family RNA polymerase sigma factor [Rhodococcus sp. BP-370]MBY6578161.1 sigma-70 family RNA polymerase sigma factor [Rhodococcus sp. BP-364]MBY6587462.1 sigma-70 family RNA polymerase sigma